MNYFYLDASAYAKFYYPELGSDVIIGLIDALPGARSRRLVVTAMTIAETIAVLTRRRNELCIPDADYGLVVTRLLADVTSFTYWRVHDEDLLNATAFILPHSLNASDALHLHTALRLDRILYRAREDRVVMVAADRRLLRAAAAEGMTTLDPEAATPGEVRDVVRAG
jgi:predicted nucleic acid-binding protein